MRILTATRGKGIHKSYFFETAWDYSLSLRNHSPSGPAWGYAGSGPSQLALAILLWANVPEAEALIHYDAFKWEVVAELPHEGWELESGRVREWVRIKQGYFSQMDMPIWKPTDTIQKTL